MLSKEYSNVGKILRLLREINIHPRVLWIPVLLSLIAAAFEGIGMGLLIPLLNGFLEKNFGFLKELPVVGDVIAMLPQSITSDDRQLFGILIVGFVLIYIFKNVFRYLSIISVGYFGERALHHLRKTLFVRYLSFGKLFFDTTNVGHHNTLLLEFAPLAFRPLFLIHKYINALFSLGVYLVVMCIISLQLTLYALPLFIVLHFAVKQMVLSIRKLSRSISEQGEELGKKSVEILSTIPLVKAHRTEVLEQKQYCDISNKKSRLDFRVRALHALMLPVQETITVMAACAIFLGSLFFIGRESIGSEPAFIVYFYIVLNASAKFGTLSNFRGTLASCTGPLDKVLSVFSKEGKHLVHSGSDLFKGIKKEIEFRNLSFSYDDKAVLKSLSVTIPRGKMTALVGPTGAGKSTFINLIMRYYNSPQGSLCIDGKDIRDFTLDSYLSKVALVSQETYLLHDSLRNNITYGLEDVSEEELLDVVSRARLQEYVKGLPNGLDTLVGDRGVMLSGGEKQRVSIARALLKGAEILILDEATSSLDSRTEKLIQEAIDEAIKDRTSIVIAHRLSTIQHADNIIVLENGTLKEQGTLQGLLRKKGKFASLWEEQKF